LTVFYEPDKSPSVKKRNNVILFIVVKTLATIENDTTNKKINLIVLNRKFYNKKCNLYSHLVLKKNQLIS